MRENFDLKTIVEKCFAFFMGMTHKIKDTFGLFFSFLVFFIFLLLILFCLFKPTQEKIVVFDFQTTYTAFLHAAAHRNLSQDEIAALGKKFPIAVTQAVNIYAQKHNAIVFTKAAVMAGTKETQDATYEIQQLIAGEMRTLTKEAGIVEKTREIKEVRKEHV